MEDWIDAVRTRVLSEQMAIPGSDWEILEAKYLASRRRRRVLPLAISIIAAAAILSAIVFFNRASSLSRPHFEPRVLVSNSELISDLEKSIFIDQSQNGKIGRVFTPSHPEPSYGQEDIVFPVESIIEFTGQETEEKESEKTETAPEPREGTPFIGQFEQEAHAGDKHRKRFSFGPAIKGFVFAHSSVTNSPIDGMGANRTFTAKHLIPLSFSLDLSLAVVPRLALSTGLELSLYRSTFFETLGGDTKEYTQNAYYLGIPLSIEWMIWKQRRFSTWVGAGGKADYLVSGKSDGLSIKDKHIHWSLIGNMGIQYQIFPRVGLFIQPEIAYYFRPSVPAVQTYRTERPFAFSMGAGLRFEL